MYSSHPLYIHDGDTAKTDVTSGLDFCHFFEQNKQKDHL
jgi:hypothetical protein